jgi:hypothetical protein
MKIARQGLLVSALTLGLFCGSCLGPNKLFNGLHDWNMQVSDSRWVNELVFLGFTILPVYGIAYLADIVVFNSIEWWGGDNPMDN